MSYNTVSYDTVLQRAAEFAGRNYQDVSGNVVLTVEESNTLRLFLGVAYRRIFRSLAWPETMAVEQRFFDQQADPAVSYAKGDVRYFHPTQLYYRALKNTSVYPAVEVGGKYYTLTGYWAVANSSHSDAAEYSSTTTYSVGDTVLYLPDRKYYVMHTPVIAGYGPTYSAYWSENAPFIRRVDWNQNGETAIGDVFGAYQVDPRTTHNPGPVEYTYTENGMIIQDELPYVWLKFRKVPDTFATAPSTVPARFSEYMALSAAGMMLKSDGKLEASEMMRGLAREVMEQECDVFTRQERQIMQITVTR